MNLFKRIAFISLAAQMAFCGGEERSPSMVHDVVRTAARGVKTLKGYFRNVLKMKEKVEDVGEEICEEARYFVDVIRSDDDQEEGDEADDFDEAEEEVA